MADVERIIAVGEQALRSDLDDTWQDMFQFSFPAGILNANADLIVVKLKSHYTSGGDSENYNYRWRINSGNEFGNRQESTLSETLYRLTRFHLEISREDAGTILLETVNNLHGQLAEGGGSTGVQVNPVVGNRRLTSFDFTAAFTVELQVRVSNAVNDATFRVLSANAFKFKAFV